MTSTERRIAYVTGSGQPLAEAIALRLQADGLEVVVCGDRPKSGQLGNVRLFQPHDMASVNRLAEEIEGSDIGVLVNAASWSVSARFLDVRMDDLRRAHMTNVMAPIRLCKAAIRAMRPGGSGRIVNMVSSWGAVVTEGASVIATTTSALSAATRAIAYDCAEGGILANCVAVGPLEETPDPHGEPACFLTSGRRVSAQEVASLVSWLASAENSFLVGQDIFADGGMSRFCRMESIGA